MIAIADGYFTGLQKNDGKGIGATGTYPFTNDCHRIENGAPTTNVPPPPGQKPGTINLFSMDCLTQFKMGLYYVVQNIHSRRYPLVDQERGVVWAHCVFDQGTVNSGVLVGRDQAQLPGLQPAEQHPGHRSVPDRKRKDPPRRDDRAGGHVSHSAGVAGRIVGQLKATGSGLQAPGSSPAESGGRKACQVQGVAQEAKALTPHPAGSTSAPSGSGCRGW